jgi:hypothetical protein
LMIGRFSIYVLIKFEIRLRLKVIYSNLLALNGTFRTVATQTPYCPSSERLDGSGEGLCQIL